ncbi:hypothetical protein V6N11_055115 [Hibiscus sabdariffa]|uniref:Uncharacterized protein n=1 Tax=Hibiscus sabdariffa TaxID=183260 RepID=A0ABR1ZPY4_9ROSI
MSIDSAPSSTADPSGDQRAASQSTQFSDLDLKEGGLEAGPRQGMREQGRSHFYCIQKASSDSSENASTDVFTLHPRIGDLLSSTLSWDSLSGRSGSLLASDLPSTVKINLQIADVGTRSVPFRFIAFLNSTLVALAVTSRSETRINKVEGALPY